MKRLAVVAALALVASLGACPADATTKHPKVNPGTVAPAPIGHRGDGTSKIAGFVAAQAAGITELEGDVRFSKATATNPCGVAVVWHDATKGAYTIADETATFWGTHGVSTLAQILDATTSTTGRYVMELKTDVSGSGSTATCQLAYYVGRITVRGLEDRWTVESFITANLTKVKSAYPALTTALISSTAVSATTAASYGSTFIPAGNVVTPTYVAALRTAGITRILPYTDVTPSMDNATGWQSLADDGVDGTMTDHGAAYLTWAAS